MLHAAIRILGTPPGQTLFVGDSPYDFQAARRAEIPVVLLPTGTHPEEELRKLEPDHFFSDLEQFGKWVLEVL